MTKASDNDYPSILLTEQGSAPSSPAASHQRLYIRTSDHTLVTVNSSGTVTPVSSGGGSATGGYITAHGARVTRSADVSVGNNTLTPIPFTAEDFDTDTIHDNSTNNTRLTIPSISGVTTGLWMVQSSGYTDENQINDRVDCTIRLNAAGSGAGGTGLAFTSVPSISAANLGVTAYMAACQYVFTAGDYVETFVRCTGSSSSVIFDAGVSPLFEIAFLGKVT